MSDPATPRVETGEEMCDHICLKPASHVGDTPHFYGYELPSPRASVRDLHEAERTKVAVAAAVREERERLRGAILEANDSGAIEDELASALIRFVGAPDAL